MLVVDTGYLPSTADADIARIRAWTDRPLRWVVNTHWHDDHVGGNRRYRQAWPQAAIAGHEETRRMVDVRLRSYMRRFVAPDSTFARQRDTLRRSAEAGVDKQGRMLEPDARRTAAGLAR